MAVLLALAAALRLVWLPTRGTWDADQGHDMRVLVDFVTHGVVPLLGPPTSIGTFHHGAGYYYLLAPATLLGGGDPVIVTAEIAVLGAVAVVLTAVAAHLLGGPLAGALAGILLAVSSSAIDESTFIWNPNLVPVASALAVVSVLGAMRTGDVRWWWVAWAAAAATMQLHVLGVLLAPAVAVAHSLELRRQDRDAAARRAIVGALAAGIAIMVVAWLPLIAHELTADFSETRGVVAFLAGGSGAGGPGLPVSLAIVAIRVLAWPLAGLITAAPFVVAVAALAVIVAAASLWRSPGADRRGVRWLIATLAWGIVGLSVAAPSLTTVVPGLPVDHYHAFLDPLVIIVTALALARVAAVVATESGRPIGSIAAAVLVVALVGWNVAHWPPAVAADGGWPAADAAARRVASQLEPNAPLVILSLPAFKPPDAYLFPLERLGVAVTDRTDRAVTTGFPTSATPAQVTVACDQLFRAALGADCGGPAEDARVGPGSLQPVDRMEVAPGRWLSLYRAGGG